MTFVKVTCGQNVNCDKYMYLKQCSGAKINIRKSAKIYFKKNYANAFTQMESDCTFRTALSCLINNGGIMMTPKRWFLSFTCSLICLSVLTNLY